MIDFKSYIKELQSIPIDQITEHSKRFALETLFRELANNCSGKNSINVLNEPKRKENYGSPDFKIFTTDSIIGYVENKKITENLDKILKSEQIKKYRELSQNLLITNYVEFVWIKGEMLQRETLCYLSDIENKKFKLDNDKAKKVEKLLLNFFSQVPEKISLPKDLALALAVRCKNLKDFINDELIRQNELNIEEGRLLQLYKSFKENIFAELTISEFSDAFAQMLIYGFSLAGLNADTKKITVRDTKYHIPASFQLIKELLNFLDELEQTEYKETKWIIDETISIINNIQWYDLTQNLSFNKKVKDRENFETDPYIYFYETFLATYDYKLRKSKGVYYTPPQVVNFIVRAIDDILKNTFNLPNGLADRNNVTVLDFATGTGTFLLEIFKIILDNLPQDSPEKRRMLIQEHILKNFFGFEYLIAPYTVAHLKLSQYLKENGYVFKDNERLQVYLTNTLEPVDKQTSVLFMPQLTKETQSAQRVKDTPILVITGNPPYSGHSKNNGDWIKNEIKKYYFIDGKPLNERNPKTLQDDYVKFIRFAQDIMDKVEQGIVGIITNHSFLDNLTFRGMRQSLMNTFDQMYFIDLHGNTKKKEKTPNNEKDQNVFDIEQGVCISLLIKKKELKKGIFHTDFWGDRNTKFKLCLDNSFKTVKYKKLKPNSPFYLFVPQNQKLRIDYDKFWSIKDIFVLNNVGIVTSNDSLTIAYENEELESRFQKIKNSELYQIKHEFKLKSNYFESRKNFFLKINEKQLEVKEITYRPFDNRRIWWDTELIERSREGIMMHFEKKNVGLITVRQVAEGIFNHVFISESLINYRVTLSNKGGAYIFPLYRYNGNGNGNENDYLFKEDDKKDNFTEQFRKFIKSKYKKHITPEQILGYIYAVLNSKTYREKYAEFLKMDFPRIPFTDSEVIFEKLSNLGYELIEKHLMKKDFPFNEFAELGNYPIAGDNIVLKPEFKTLKIEQKTQHRLYINKTQYFETVPEDVYNFYIGGYQVLDKYLKDRKGRSIGNDLYRITEIIKTLYFTIQQMELIDNETKDWL